MPPRKVTDEEYRRIFAFRIGIRRFLDWSRRQAETAGITATQHQLLLTIRGIDHRSGATVGQIADSLALRHHSAVELVDRAVEKGLVQRLEDNADKRVVRVKLTSKGGRILEAITLGNLKELTRLAPELTRLLNKLSGEELVATGPNPGGAP
jgi:DNA-binding MarR family transcriptional regulator